MMFEKITTYEFSHMNVFRQAEFIHGVAVIDGSYSGIDHWWIGLTDLGRYINPPKHRVDVIIHGKALFSKV
jgi:hypothetical protein